MMEDRGFRAEMLLDSVNTGNNCRIRTFRLRYPLIVHAEFCRHRALSRSVASNRAIPTSKLIETVLTEPYIPEKWGANRPGMQATEFLEGEAAELANSLWKDAAIDAVFNVRRLTQGFTEDLGGVSIHKQWANRLLLPFQWVNEIITGTEFDNLYGLRIHGDAQYEIAKIVRMMYEVQQKSEPQQLVPGSWHIPLLQPEEKELPVMDQLYHSVARHARTSLYVHDTGKISTWEEDVSLYGRLMGSTPRHVSPSEHQAWAIPGNDLVDTPIYEMFERDNRVDPMLIDWVSHPRFYGPLQGWMSFRYMHEDHTIERYEPDAA